MFSKPPFMPLFLGVVMVVLIIWIIVTPVIVGCGPWEAIPSPADSVAGVPPNQRLQLSGAAE